nr:immunoglobulin heavy chain junction region [Macaca mulatta]MOY24430.1 immunoglobulin heavy chain junction region [Macaca mulatta]MOY25244.1 immunoglobulin heavy chain junction region [Macaca mulatta]MOY26323.1 immunoglobulin heavy chain junction region [Macaca mulatta]MOY27312.1 immunoglobulin heavy chain junction region [Macaca mulatta]
CAREEGRWSFGNNRFDVW